MLLHDETSEVSLGRTILTHPMQYNMGMMESGNEEHSSPHDDCVSRGAASAGKDIAAMAASDSNTVTWATTRLQQHSYLLGND